MSFELVNMTAIMGFQLQNFNRIALIAGGSIRVQLLVLGACVLSTMTAFPWTLWTLLVNSELQSDRTSTMTVFPWTLEPFLSIRSGEKVTVPSFSPLFVAKCSSGVPSGVFSFQDLSLKALILLREELSRSLSYSLFSHVLNVVVRIPTCLEFFGCIVVKAETGKRRCLWLRGKSDAPFLFFVVWSLNDNCGCKWR